MDIRRPVKGCSEAQGTVLKPLDGRDFGEEPLEE